MRPSFGRWLLGAALALTIAGLLYLLRTVLVPLVFAFFLAYFIEPLVLVLQKRGASRSLAVLTVYAIAVILSAAFCALVVPRLLDDLQRAAKAVPQYLERIDNAGDRLASIYQRLRLPANIRAALDRLAAKAVGRVEAAVGSVFTLVIEIIPGSLILLIVPIASYYISRDYRRARRVVHTWLERKSNPDWLALAVSVDRVLRAYFQGLAIEMLTMTIILSIGLTLLGLDFALLLGLVAGIFNVIPYFGPILGALPSVLSASARSPWHVIYVIALFTAANQFEAAVLVPRVLGGRVGLHPLLVIFALLTGGRFFGLVGMLVAVPAAAVIKVAVSEYRHVFMPPESGLTTPRASAMMEKEKKPTTPEDSG